MGIWGRSDENESKMDRVSEGIFLEDSRTCSVLALFQIWEDSFRQLILGGLSLLPNWVKQCANDPVGPFK